jgi:S-adenosyl-L-methionine hydrolase (adenosine-forming)
VPPAGPLITLLTDFGDRDYFVASMKGVILSIHPAARIVDLSHHITPYRIHEAAYLLKSCYRYFPGGTIHVSVVDPGVGTARRPLLVSTARYYFLAPDNGLLTYVMEEEERVEIRRIENRRYRLEAPGATFDGRDLFAPAAAWLAKGEPPASFGKPIADPVRFDHHGPVRQNQRLIGRIVYVDRFGNLISDISAKQLGEVQASGGGAGVAIRLGDHVIAGLVGSYGEGSAERPHALINSNGYVEIFLKEGSAADRLGVRPGAAVDCSAA